MNKLFIALTGGIACGKTSVLNYFDDFKKYLADDIVSELYNDPKLARLFTKNNLSKYVKNNAVNKDILKKDFFNDGNLKKLVESIVHPLVTNKILKLKSTKNNVIVEVPLLFEVNLEAHFDFIICVYSKKEDQITRLKHKLIDKDNAINIINQQLDLNFKLLNSDFIINNNGDKKKLKTKTKKVIQILNKKASVKSTLLL